MAKLFALLGMLCWGIAPIFGKIGLKSVDSMTAMILRTLFAGTLVAGWVFIAPSTNTFQHVSIKTWIFIAAEAILATLIGDLAYFIALRRGNINDVTLIMSCSPLVTMLLSYFFLAEKISLYHYLGGFLIICGLMLIGLEPKF